MTVFSVIRQKIKESQGKSFALLAERTDKTSVAPHGIKVAENISPEETAVLVLGGFGGQGVHLRGYNGYLKKWADQGVLLLNTVLTVRAHQANSHQGRGWEQFTDAVIEAVNAQDRPIVFLLWGRPAQAKAEMLTNPKHLILKAPHPSPLSASRGFFGCRHFSKANAFLKEHGAEPIDWQIENR